MNSKTGNKWLFIWIILLCMGIVATGIMIGLSIVEANHRREADRRQIDANAAAITLLCDRGYILNDMILDWTVLIKQNPQLKGDIEFIRSMELHYAEILDQLTTGDSPCVISQYSP